MQAIGRLGNFFNQELYGPPTTLPWGSRSTALTAWGLPVQRVPARHDVLPPAVPVRVAVGAARVPHADLAGRPAKRLVSGDLLGIFFIWYGLTRFVLEFFRYGNWTFYGIPVAQIVTLGFIVFGIAIIWYRHGPGRPAESEAATASRPRSTYTAEDFETFDYGADRPTTSSTPGTRPTHPQPEWSTRATTRPRNGAVRHPDASRPRRWPTPAAERRRARLAGPDARVEGVAALPGDAAPRRGRSWWARSASGSRPPARSTCRAAATSSSGRPIAAGWTRSSSSTRSPRSRGPGSSAAARRRSRRAGARAHPPPRRPAPRLARRRRRRGPRQVGPGRHRERRRLRPDAGGTVSGPPDRSGRSATAGR